MALIQSLIFVSTSLLTTCPGWSAEEKKSLSAASPRLRAAESSGPFSWVGASSSHFAGSNSVVAAAGAADLASSAAIIVLQGQRISLIPNDFAGKLWSQAPQK